MSENPSAHSIDPRAEFARNMNVAEAADPNGATAFDRRAWLDAYPEWVPHNIEISNETLTAMYDANLKKNPDKPAMWFFGKSQTYAELDQSVRACAAGLKAFGIRPGDRVAVVLPNCPQHIAAFYAILKLGATVVEHNPLYTAHELEKLFQDHGARVAICWDKTAPVLEELRETTELETVVSVNMIDAMPTRTRLLLKLPIPPINSKREELSVPAPNTVEWSTLLGHAIGGRGDSLETCDSITPDTTALILYTSGTTGPPKGAQLTHGNLYANCAMGLAWVPGLGDVEERMLGALPMFHVYGLTMVGLLCLLVGGEMILAPAPKVPLIMDIFKKHPPTWIPGVPTLFEKIIQAAEENGQDLSGVHASFSGAAALPVETVERWEALTGGKLVEGYGLTETSPIVVANPMDGNRRPGYIGLPFPNTEVRIANPDNLSETQPDGVEGEIVVRGPQVFKGYLNRPDATEDAFHEGWFRTGDMGVMEEDGFIRVVSRIKEIIITGGFNVYPGEVEEELLTHPDIDECAVVGLPRSDGSEDVVACVILRDGAALDPEGLKDYARKRLPRYKVPRTFYHFEELAQDQLGKIRRREVQKQLVELLAANKV